MDHTSRNTDAKYHKGFPDGSAGKDPPEIQELQTQSLGQEDALEEEMATHSSILAWKIPWTEDPGGLLSMGSQRVGCDVVTKQQHNNEVQEMFCFFQSESRSVVSDSVTLWTVARQAPLSKGFSRQEC